MMPNFGEAAEKCFAASSHYAQDGEKQLQFLKTAALLQIAAELCELSEQGRRIALTLADIHDKMP
jgi:hypothetical protein